MWHIIGVWKAIETEEFGTWFDSLDDDAKEGIVVKIEVLKTLGPMLGRPLVDSLKGSRHSNLKELRVVSNGRPFRILFAFFARFAVNYPGPNSFGGFSIAAVCRGLSPRKCHHQLTQPVLSRL